MSSTAPQLRSRLPRIAEAAVQRARLTVVPRTRRRTRAPRVPFVTLVSAVLLAGVIGLLLFNTSMQQASFQETAMERQARDLAARQEALALDVQELRDPERLARMAQAAGMVIPTTPAGTLDLRTGRIDGDPQPATGTGLPLAEPGPDRPAELDPPPVVDRDERGRSDRSDRRDRRDRRDGAANRDRDRDRPRLGAGERSQR